MELKRIFITLIIIILTNNLKAEILKPTNKLLPYEVVKIQLNALKNNSKLKDDLGIQQVWLFAHPNNKKITGPYDRFRIMIYGNQYRILLDHSSHKINLVMNTQEKYIYRVEILDKDKKLFVYEWHLAKGNEKDCMECWFTTAVSVPIDQGNTI